MAAIPGSVAIPKFLNALDYARQGIDNGVQSFDKVAQQVAAAGAGSAAVSAHAVVGALEARNQVAVSARVFEAGQQMLGTLLDLRA